MGNVSEDSIPDGERSSIGKQIRCTPSDPDVKALTVSGNQKNGDDVAAHGDEHSVEYGLQKLVERQQP